MKQSQEHEQTNWGQREKQNQKDEQLNNDDKQQHNNKKTPLDGNRNKYVGQSELLGTT